MAEGILIGCVREDASDGLVRWSSNGYPRRDSRRRTSGIWPSEVPMLRWADAYFFSAFALAGGTA